MLLVSWFTAFEHLANEVGKRWSKKILIGGIGDDGGPDGHCEDV
jgi:hypothetical protein